MSVLKNKTNRENFLIVSKVFLQDTTLSISERGLLATMHSLPDNWEFTISGMTKILPDGKAKISSALEGLIAKGYLTKKQSKSQSGCFGRNIIEINEKPITKKPIPQKPLTEKPPTEKPPTENQSQYNNNKYSINIYNINQSINHESEEIDEIRDDIKYQINYDYACKELGKDWVDGIIDIMMEVFLAEGSITVNKHSLPVEQVKNIFCKIDLEHLRYIFDQLEETSKTKKIKNMKSYLLTALYNAPMTIDSFYNAEVNYDQNNQEE